MGAFQSALLSASQEGTALDVCRRLWTVTHSCPVLWPAAVSPAHQNMTLSPRIGCMFSSFFFSLCPLLHTLFLSVFLSLYSLCLSLSVSLLFLSLSFFLSLSLCLSLSVLLSLSPPTSASVSPLSDLTCYSTWLQALCPVVHRNLSDELFRLFSSWLLTPVTYSLVVLLEGF